MAPLLEGLRGAGFDAPKEATLVTRATGGDPAQLTPQTARTYHLFAEASRRARACRRFGTKLAFGKGVQNVLNRVGHRYLSA